MSATDKGCVRELANFGTIYCVQCGTYASCRIFERVDNQGLSERHLVVKYDHGGEFRARIPDRMSTPAVDAVIRYPKIDDKRFPAWEYPYQYYGVKEVVPYWEPGERQRLENARSASIYMLKELSMAEELENGRESEMTRSYSSGRSYSR
jgi:hypothetical protein